MLTKSVLWCFSLLPANGTLAAEGQEKAVDLQQVRDAMAGLAGEWRGSLTYIDYGNGNEYEIPLATRQEPNPDRTALVSWNAYTDPGVIVHTVDVTAVDGERGIVTIAGFRGGEATVLEFRVAAVIPSASHRRSSP